MAELFNPNEFRQQIAAQTQGGHSGGPGSQNPVYAPQQTCLLYTSPSPRDS